MGPEEIAHYLPHVSGWSIEGNKRLRRTYRFKDFATALDFVSRVGAVAEEQDHHPDLYLAWGKVEAILWTHTIDGLTENDFILAAKTDALAKDAPGLRAD